KKVPLSRDGQLWRRPWHGRGSRLVLALKLTPSCSPRICALGLAAGAILARGFAVTGASWDARHDDANRRRTVFRRCFVEHNFSVLACRSQCGNPALLLSLRATRTADDDKRQADGLALLNPFVDTSALLGFRLFEGCFN